MKTTEQVILDFKKDFKTLLKSIHPSHGEALEAFIIQALEDQREEIASNLKQQKKKHLSVNSNTPMKAVENLMIYVEGYNKAVQACNAEIERIADAITEDTHLKKTIGKKLYNRLRPDQQQMMENTAGAINFSVDRNPDDNTHY